MSKSIHRPEYVVLRRKIRDMRLAAGFTQAELSARLGRDQTYVSNMERGVRRIDVLELRDLCRLTKQDLLEFVRELERELVAKPRRR